MICTCGTHSPDPGCIARDGYLGSGHLTFRYWRWADMLRARVRLHGATTDRGAAALRDLAAVHGYRIDADAFVSGYRRERAPMTCGPERYAHTAGWLEATRAVRGIA